MTNLNLSCGFIVTYHSSMGIWRSPSIFALLLFLLPMPLLGSETQSPPSPQKKTLRWLLSLPSYSVHLEDTLKAIVREFNQINPTLEVDLHIRGEDYSSLRELTVASMAGSRPDFASIEPSESESLRSVQLSADATRIPAAKLKRLAIDPAHWGRPLNSIPTLPLFRALPLLVVDQEALARLGEDFKQLPQDWSALERLLQKLVQSATILDDSQGQFALAFPTTGVRALFGLEALTSTPLWISEGITLKTPSSLNAHIATLRGLFLTPRSSRAGLNWEQSLQLFLDRKVPLLITSTDTLPLLQARVRFQWATAPLPSVRGSPSRLATGSDLLVFNASPEAWAFIQYLFSPRVAARWSSTGGVLPLHASWTTTSEWRRAEASGPNLTRTLKLLIQSPVRVQTRASHPDILKIRAEWSQRAPSLWQEPQVPTTAGAALEKINHALSLLSGTRP